LNKKIAALKAAFPHTIPILMGFLFLGIAFGILLSSKGYTLGWALLMSIFIFAGSMQFVAIDLLTQSFNPINAFFLTLLVNARHLFYGISMLSKYRNTGKKKAYLIFGLIDESFSILCSTEPPAGVDRGWFMFFVTLFNHIYWVAASAMGALLGSLFTFNSQGIEFVMTALFIVIFINQWKSQKNHIPALTGLGVSLSCLIILGPNDFIIPSMILILLVLSLFRKNIEKEVAP
jgi:4-azaleucine resistance transporter AzlC